MSRPFDVIVLGGGAAGLMCAIEAGKRGRRVAVLDGNDRLGRKILISGGGRCNFTNIHCSPDNFISANPHFARSALARYEPSDFVALVERHAIRYHEKTLGQLFCDGSAREIVSMLERECRDAGAEIVLNARVQEVREGFVVQAGEREFRAPALVVATGGLSIPKIGATSLGYDVAGQFGLKIVEPRPALVPLLWSAADRKRYGELSGLSTEVIATAGGRPFREKMLFTHKGLSGPAILQASSYWREGKSVAIDLAPGVDAFSDQPRDLQSAKAALRGHLPHRLADRWLEVNAPDRWTNEGLRALEHTLHDWEVRPAGT